MLELLHIENIAVIESADISFRPGFTALPGAVSHFAIGGLPDMLTWEQCVVFTLLWARIAAVFANRAQPKTLNRATGVVLVVLGLALMGFQLLA